MTRRPVLLALAALAALPATAGAGDRVTSGDQALRVTGLLSPHRLRVQFVYDSLNQDAGIKESPRTTTIALPSAVKLHPARRPVCRLSKLQAARNRGAYDPSQTCPKRSLVGIGPVTYDGRSAPCESDPCIVPLCPRPPATFVAGAVLINGLDDVRRDGTRRAHGLPALLVAPSTSGRLLPFDIEGSRLVLRSERMSYCGFVHIHRLDMRLVRRGFVTAPRACRPLSFAVSIANYDGPTITARDTVPCRP